MRRHDRVDALLAEGADLVVGERAVERAEPQREREAHAARAECFGAEDVEQLDVLEQLSARLRKGGLPSAAAGT